MPDSGVFCDRTDHKVRRVRAVRRIQWEDRQSGYPSRVVDHNYCEECANNVVAACRRDDNMTLIKDERLPN